MNHGRRRRSVLLVTGLAAAALTSCTSADPNATAPASTRPAMTQPAPTQPARTATPVPPSPSSTTTPSGQFVIGEDPITVASGLDAPWSVAFHEGAPLVSERDSARILEIVDGGATRVVGTVDGVVSLGEGGLLGLAVVDEQWLYVYSTAADGNRIQRFPLTGASGSLSLGEAEDILTGIPSASYHNGGRIAIGPDGMLYATTGDAGQTDNAQDLASLGGKVLRMEPDGTVPEDNPFPGSPVFSYGHRNPQGLVWDGEGTMFVAEFGQNTWDELNIITPGSNYGWPSVEGISTTEEYVDPVQQWEPRMASPSGMTYLDGSLYIANLRGEVLRAVPATDPGTSTDYYTGEYGRIRDVVAGPDGNLWVLTSNTDGRGNPTEQDDRLLRVEAAAP